MIFIVEGSFQQQIGEVIMSKQTTSKKVTPLQLNNHKITNKRQALKDLKNMNWDVMQYIILYAGDNSYNSNLFNNSSYILYNTVNFRL